jgi:perosamine synthetase
MPAFTIISCAAAIVKAGGIPVLVDCDENTWNMKTEEIGSKITHRTKAIMVVHIYGLPVDMDSVVELAAKHKLVIIEDAAEGLGLKYKNRLCGSFGHINVFSFYPNKLITTGEGGMVLTNDHDLAEKCRSVRNLCFLPHKRFVHENLGSNFRMTNMQAAVGVAQLEKWEASIEKKKWIGKTYHDLLHKVEGIKLPLEATEDSENIYWVYGIILQNGRTAEEVTSALSEKGIGTRPFFCPMHLQPVFRKMNLFLNDKHPNAEHLYKYGFYLPSGLSLTTEQINRVVKELKELL